MDLPGSIQSKLVWLAGFIAIGSGGLLALDGSRQVARLGFTLGSVVVMACVVGAWLFSRPPSRTRIPKAHTSGAILGLLFMACGLTWMIPAQLPVQDELQLNNATTILLTGGALPAAAAEGQPFSASAAQAHRAILVASGKDAGSQLKAKRQSPDPLALPPTPDTEVSPCGRLRDY